MVYSSSDIQLLSCRTPLGSTSSTEEHEWLDNDGTSYKLRDPPQSKCLALFRLDHRLSTPEPQISILRQPINLPLVPDLNHLRPVLVSFDMIGHLKHSYSLCGTPS